MRYRSLAANRLGTLGLFILLAAFAPARAEAPPQTQPTGGQLLARVLAKWSQIVVPEDQSPPQAFVARLKVVESHGLPSLVSGATAEIAIEAPSHLRLLIVAGGNTYSAGRDGNELWFDEPAKKFALQGRSGLPLFLSTPQDLDTTQLPPLSLPVSRLQMAALPLLIRAERLEPQAIGGRACDGLRLTPIQSVAASLHVSGAVVQLFFHHDDLLPSRVSVNDGKDLQLQIDFEEAKGVEPLAAESWKLHASPDTKVQVVPVAHLAHFVAVAPSMLLDKTTALGPADGERRVIAVEGKGRLEMIDGTRVLTLQGSPQEMGHQHGTLLKKEINQVVDRILYGVGVASSFEKGSWFFGDIEAAEARLQPHIDPRYLAEMDGIAMACGRRPEEARLANFFPELFHCSGFSIFGKATRDGHMYHGRVLDYLRGVGLEKNAVVIVHRPDYGRAWVNISYAGFVGSVTAMNEKGVAIGEMGGRGWGDWDGKPMAELLREVMEKSDTIDDAIRIIQAGPRTCQYYYVVSDGKSKRAVGIGATHDQCVIIQPGEFHPMLPRPMEDAVLMSAGKRYETLAERVKSGYGTFDADSARELMSPPVCMQSNIQSVLFAPDTLDFWVANADSSHVASETRFTHYNLADLLKQ